MAREVLLALAFPFGVILVVVIVLLLRAWG